MFLEHQKVWLTLFLCFPFFPFPKLADIDSSPSKEDDDDDDDTMQNTVVLFSNTDKFVLMQVGIRAASFNIFLKKLHRLIVQTVD